MKTIRLKHIIAAIAALVLADSTARTSAQTFITESYTNTFATGTNVEPFAASGSVRSWLYWYNTPGNNIAITNDVTMDANSDPSSGSLLVSSPFGVPGTQNVFFGTFGNQFGYDFGTRADLTKYTNITFDIRVKTNMTPNAAGNFGSLGVGIINASYGYQQSGSVTIPASATNGWVRFSVKIDQTQANLASVPGICFAYNNYGGYPQFPMIFWIDNVTVNRSKDVLPPPRMSPIISEPTSGLNLFSSSAGDQFQRTSIKLISTIGTGWLGQGSVTYSFTIKDFPSAATYTNYQAHIFLTTGPGNNSGLDYGETNVIFLDIKENANGTANAVFRYKTNQPQGNAMIYGAGTLGSVGSTNIRGTWSLTFNQDTNIIVTAPNGNTFATNITADAAALFSEPLNVVFGAQPNNVANVGQKAVLANASVTNAGAGISIVNDDFLDDTALDTSTWTRLAAAANNVQIFPPDPGQKLITWSLPDAGFGLQVTTNLANSNAWTILTGNEYFGQPLLQFPTSSSRATLVPSTYLGPTQNFFRLFTRRFTKLQVLMPGESAAPGTPTGKTGTPDPQQVNAPFIVTVNAVDANWNLAVTGGDSIHLTSSSGTAALPADGPLVGGTRNFNVTITTAGTFTITATDVDDPTKTPNTGSSTTANP